jgi:type VI secretion system secreted protein VgrG
LGDQHVYVEASVTVAGTAYRALRYELSEGLSRVSTLSCEILDDTADAPDPADLVGKPAELSLERSDGSAKRTFSGEVVEVERIPDDDGVRTTRLTVVPAVWKLGKRADCRIFQKLSVVDIAKKVLTGGGVPAGQQQWKVSGSYPARDYTVQYRETDLDFILRLFSEEGIYFAVHFEDGKDMLVVGDDPKGLGDVEGAKSLRFLAEMGFQGAIDHVTRVSQKQQVRSDKVMLRDYDPDKPKVKLESKAEGKDDGSHSLEVYQYPGRFTDAGQGDRLAKVLLDSIQAERDVVSGQTGVLSLSPGLCFSVEEHPYEPLNQEYLVTSVHIEWSLPRHGASAGGGAPRYACEFEAIPTKTSPYRPPRRPRAASIPGAQTAMTTGPSGQEIHVNEGGQVKVQYPWDRLQKKDDGSSRWIRTSQLAVGGGMFLPRTNWEVSMRHLEGDPDRPMVMGRMYNAVTPPPYALPENKERSSIQTATTPGGGSSNEIRMNDTKGKEEMFMNGSKDMSTDVKNNTTEAVGGSQTKNVGGSQKKNVTNSVQATVGGSQSVSVGGAQKVHVETFKVDQVGGSHSLSIGGSRNMKVGGDHKRDVGADSTLHVGGSSIDLVVGTVTDKTMADMSHDVSAALVELTVANKSLSVGGSYKETAAAVKVIACGGPRAVKVGAAMSQKVAGAIINSANANRVDASGGAYTEVAAGAQLIKAAGVTFEAKSRLSIVMGASTITLLPAAVAIAGVSVKLDGDVDDTGALVVDN